MDGEGVGKAQGCWYRVGTGPAAPKYRCQGMYQQVEKCIMCIYKLLVGPVIFFSVEYSF